MQVLTNLLDLIMQPCFNLTGNWWAAIFLFTVIVKVILMPMALWCQKNSIVMVELMPDLNRIRVKYFGDNETIGEKQNELFKEKHYHPMLSLVPLAVQIIILFGLVDVIHRITDNGVPGTEFLGLIPIENGGSSWIMPLLAGVSAVIMGCAQNRINPLQREQSKLEKNVTNGLSIALSLFLGIFVAAGMAFYWVCSNLTSILVQIACNVVIPPKKYVDYIDLQNSKVELEKIKSLATPNAKWYKRDNLANRERSDYKRFFNIVDKHIVFYSERSGFYKYFQGVISWLLNNSDVIIHYVTNDSDDQIFDIAKKHPRIFPYYIGEQKAITLMMKMDADVVVSTLEDLETFYIKRSYVRKDIDYVFIPHHMTSMHLCSSKTAYDHYDVILCTGPHQITEIREIERQRSLHKKTLVECGYDLLDCNIANYEKLLLSENRRKSSSENIKPTLIIAPSWQEDCILDSCIEELIDSIIDKGYKIIVRPHPEYTKRYAARWHALQEKFACIDEDELYFEKDFSSNETIFTSDLLITDWSTVFCEFCFSTLNPVVFINTPMKVTNPEWKSVGIMPTDISLRGQVGMTIELSELEKFPETIEEMLRNREIWKERIFQIRKNFLFNIGACAEVAGKFLLELILDKQKKRINNIDKAA